MDARENRVRSSRYAVEPSPKRQNFTGAIEAMKSSTFPLRPGVRRQCWLVGGVSENQNSVRIAPGGLPVTRVSLFHGEQKPRFWRPKADSLHTKFH